MPQLRKNTRREPAKKNPSEIRAMAGSHGILNRIGEGLISRWSGHGTTSDDTVREAALGIEALIEAKAVSREQALAWSISQASAGCWGGPFSEWPLMAVSLACVGLSKSPHHALATGNEAFSPTLKISGLAPRDWMNWQASHQRKTLRLSPCAAESESSLIEWAILCQDFKTTAAWIDLVPDEKFDLAWMGLALGTWTSDGGSHEKEASRRLAFAKFKAREERMQLAQVADSSKKDAAHESEPIRRGALRV